MESLNIGIVEDELLIAESIAVTLKQIGYRHTSPSRTYAEALAMIESEKPDLLLIDIGLAGPLDGIDLAHKVQDEYGMPFIFLTANSDKATVERAKSAKPYAYLVKPFNEQDLFTAIEIAFNSYYEEQKKQQPVATLPLREVIFIKEGLLFHKVSISDIQYVESDNVYLNIYTDKKHFVIRSKLDSFLQEFGQDTFFRIHRSFAININHLDTINSLTVRVAGKEIPLQRNYRDILLQVIKSLN